MITTLKGFLGRSYVFSHCFKPYDQAGKHHCKIKIQCRCCLQQDCPDFHYAYPRGLKATQRCHDCGRDFFGDMFFEAHRSKTHEGKTAEVWQGSICFNRRRCVGCLKLEVGFKHIERHRCGYLDCPSCHEYVNAQSHRCFSQKALSPQEMKEQKKERKRKRQKQQGVLLPNGVLPLVFKPCGPTKVVMTRATTRRNHHHPCTCFLTLKPCSPKNNTWPISLWAKPKRIRDPSVFKENIA